LHSAQFFERKSFIISYLQADTADFPPILTQWHLKNYKGWQRYAAYCPLGIGMVDIPAILKMLESKGLQTGGMVEFDPSNDGLMTSLGTKKNSKA
jgi:hypothetical protein